MSNYTDNLEYYTRKFIEFAEGRPLSICEVSAKMPSSVRSPYCHIRVYPSGTAEPFGNALRNLTDGVDYYECSRIHAGSRGPRSEYAAIIRAVAAANEVKTA